MKRGYTVSEYREMHARIKEMLPDAAVTSDFIVGFSGETDADFQQTIDLAEECRFKNNFIFKYSERPGTKGAEILPDDIPESVKRERNNALLAVTNRIAEEEMDRFLGRTVEVLAEGPSKTALKQGASPTRWTGNGALEQIDVAPQSDHASVLPIVNLSTGHQHNHEHHERTDDPA